MRIEGWESLLSRHIEQAGEFAWGSNDCALWCAEWVRKATGTDLAAPYRGKYGTEAELTALLHAHGLASAADIADKHLPPVPLMFAKRGDIVLHPMGPLGICSGCFSYFLTETGITRIETLRCRRAWEVD